ncbi:MAG TPA: formate dehydrogenase accessory protein FdhE [Candidatus Hypogeohydataceae bacterium YC41]
MTVLYGETISLPSWDSKIERCKVLAHRYTFASEILIFYHKILSFQKGLYDKVKGNKGVFTLNRKPGAPERGLECRLDMRVLKKGVEILFPLAPSLLLIASEGPPLLAAMSKEVSHWGPMGWEAVIEDYRLAKHREQPLFFFPRVLLQPYLQYVLDRLIKSRERTPPEDRHAGLSLPRCPFCGHSPQTGYLRPVDNASQRFLICALCQGEWQYKRLACPGCGESNETKLSCFVAEGCPAVRLDVCETCGRYIKTVDLGKDPEAVPVVDELATAPLDLWAREQGYEKLELNLAGI